MRLLADLHISPRTVAFLRGLGHDIVRADDQLPRTAADAAIIEAARAENRVVLTQDLDFSALIAVKGDSRPSLISLRLSSSQIEHVNEVLGRVLPAVEEDVMRGMIICVEDDRIRRRSLPVG